MILTQQQKQRYNRHLILDGFGPEAQQRLLESKILLVGAGGLGSAAALYLASAGVGTMGIADGDMVSISNLQRQVIHSTQAVGQFKTDSAAERISSLNPDVRVVRHTCFLTEENAARIIADYDFVVDGTDNFSAKYLVNDACVMLGKPCSIGGILRYQGQLMTYVPGHACYRCIFPEPPAMNEVLTCSMVGVLGSIAGMLGTIQATECIKYLAGVGEPLTDTLLTFDALTMQWNRMSFGRNCECPLCGSHPTITEIKEYGFKPCSKTNR